MQPQYVLVVTATPASTGLGPDALDAVLGALPADCREGMRWLAPATAWETSFSIGAGETGAAALAIRDRVRCALEGKLADANVLPARSSSRRKKLLVADMESTIIREELIDELADYAGLRDKVSLITERAMRGELEFEGALRERVALLAGLDAGILDEIYERRVSLMPGAEALVATMKANGAHCALVSGGFGVFAERVARRLGFDSWQANHLEIENRQITGRVREPILGRAAKRAALERLTRELGLDVGETLSVGDGANDLDMLGAAGLGVAFRAKPAVQERALSLPSGGLITHGDLTALLHLQGYAVAEFAHAG